MALAERSVAVKDLTHEAKRLAKLLRLGYPAEVILQDLGLEPWQERFVRQRAEKMTTVGAERPERSE